MQKRLILRYSRLLLILHLAHRQISIISLRILAELFNQEGSLHLDLLSVEHARILHCHEPVTWLLQNRFWLGVLKSGHSRDIHVKLNGRGDRKALRSGRRVFGLSVDLKLVELCVGH